MLYVLCGPSYCGKSTYANELKNHISAHGTNVTIINPDSIREELLGDASDQSHGDLVFKTAYQRVEEALSNNDIVIFDATNLTLRARKPLIEIAKRYNEMVIAIVFKDLSMGELVSRYTARERKVPLEIVEKQRQKFTLPTRAEGFDRVWKAEEYIDTLR